MKNIKISWKDLEIGDCFLGPGGMYKKLSEHTVFYFNGHSEIPVDVEKNKNNKVFTKIENG
jgi:hypothetical protein